MALSDQIIGAESGGDPNAQNPNSSAAGAGQFIDSTWLGLIKQHRPDLAQGKSDSDLLGMRSDPDLSKAMVSAYADQNAAVLGQSGVPPTPGNLYLAHFAGPQGAVRILNADPSAPAASVMGPAAAAANPFLKNMSVADLQKWAAGRVGGTGPTAAPADGAAATAAPPQPAPTAPLSLSPPAPPVSDPSVVSAPSTPSLGLLNNPQAFAKIGKMLGGTSQQASPSPMPALSPLPQGTPAAAAIRARLLASIFSPTG